MSAVYCLTVKVKPEGFDLLLLFDGLTPQNLIDEIEKGLADEYRTLNSVSEWCFHTDDHNPFPGEFGHCKFPGERDKWLVDQASKVFGWQ